MGFYKKYPEYKESELYISGESYAGHYIPAMANYLFVKTDIKISGLLIGNGWVDPFYQYPAYSTFAKSNGLIKDQQSAALNVLFHFCQYSLLINIPYVTTIYCEGLMNTILSPFSPEFNYYDIRLPCEGPFCYPPWGLDELMNSELYRNYFNITGIYEW